MIPQPADDTMAPPPATAAQPELPDQINPQQPFSGAVAGNEPATPSQASYLNPAQAHVDSSAASQASESSDSTVSSAMSTVPPPSNVGGLESLVYNPSATPGGSVLDAFRLWLMHPR